MKKRHNHFGFSLIGFIAFFITIAITTTASILVFQAVNVSTGGNTALIILAVVGSILMGSIICTISDVFRRKNMVDKPTNEILEATQRITKGDFNFKIDIKHSFDKYDEYDVIKLNINKMIEELSKNEVLKIDFISSVSHEIKTPLAIIQNYATALQNTNLSEEKKVEYLNALTNATKKLSNLISNILKLNKLENQKIVANKEKIDLAELLRMCVLSFESLLEAKNLELECDIDECTIVSSANMLEIVFNNLLSNAIKFTSKGKISVSLKNEGELAIIAVKDTGCGISKEVGEHIFDKFYQGDTSHLSEGNGLGLALVKKVIDNIGGTIYVESKVEEGSTFIIKLKK